MSDFFNSPVVRAAMAEIHELQEDLMQLMASKGFNPYSPLSSQHIRTMKSLVEKQKNFMFRLSLEKDDRDAVEMKKQIIESAKFLGLKPNEDINKFFDNLRATLDRLESQIPKEYKED
tara:strand:- start:19581 stop:19934 length:354 start_codon:yes stop_codon:yes gene_type:complete